MNKSKATDPTSIHDIISVYSAGLKEPADDVFQKLEAAIREYGQPKRFMRHAMRNTHEVERLMAIFTDVIRGWHSRGKSRVARILRQFATYLREQQGIPLDVGALPKDIPDVAERRLDMLKFLQTPQTMEALEARYLTSQRTLREDLNVLVSGWDFMGIRIQIQRVDTDQGISYNSTAHPILLPLNLTEVYALVAGFPALAEGTMFAEISRYLAEAIASQLSERATSIMAQSVPGSLAAERMHSPLAYRQEPAMLAHSRNNWLIYLTKQGMRCRVTYSQTSGKVSSIEGVPRLQHGAAQALGFQGSELLVPLANIIHVEALEAYR